MRTNATNSTKIARTLLEIVRIFAKPTITCAKTTKMPGLILITTSGSGTLVLFVYTIYVRIFAANLVRIGEFQ